MMEEEEPLTMDELRLARQITENQNSRLRDRLTMLARTKRDGWRETFHRVHDELVRRSGLVGRLERRIRAAVENEAGPAREEGNDARPCQRGEVADAQEGR